MFPRTFQRAPDVMSLTKNVYYKKLQYEKVHYKKGTLQKRCTTKKYTTKSYITKWYTTKGTVPSLPWHDSNRKDCTGRTDDDLDHLLIDHDLDHDLDRDLDHDLP